LSEMNAIAAGGRNLANPNGLLVRWWGTIYLYELNVILYDIVSYCYNRVSKKKIIVKLKYQVFHKTKELWE